MMLYEKSSRTPHDLNGENPWLSAGLGILGHEAGAIVESIGEGVTSVPADAKVWLGLNYDLLT